MTDVTLTKNEARLVGDLLRFWADVAGNASCNDLERPEWFPQNEWDELGLKLATANVTPEDFVPGQKVLMDFSVMDWAANVLSPEEVQS